MCSLLSKKERNNLSVALVRLNAHKNNMSSPCVSMKTNNDIQYFDLFNGRPGFQRFEKAK